MDASTQRAALLLLLAATSCRSAGTRLEPRHVDTTSHRGVHIDAIDVDVDLIRVHITLPGAALKKAFLLSSQTADCHDGVSGAVWNHEPNKSAILSFALQSINPALEADAFLAVELESVDANPRCIKIPLAPRAQTLRGADYGFGHAFRLKRGAIGTSLGIDRWFGDTRLRLSVESGIAACGWLADGRPGCLTRVPLAAGFDASQALAEGETLTLGASVGYDVGLIPVIEERDAQPQDEPLVHGPRVALLLWWSRKRSPWFSSAPANDIQALEFGASLYQRHWLENIVVTPSVGWLWTVPF